MYTNSVTNQIVLPVKTYRKAQVLTRNDVKQKSVQIIFICKRVKDRN